jgi:proline dehydrogenase
MRNTARAILRAMAERAARSYVVGPNLSDAVGTCRTLTDHGFLGTLCQWNSASDTPPEMAAGCAAAIDAVARAELDCAVSLKAHDLRFSHDLVSQIFDRAYRQGVDLHFDSMGPEQADETFSLLSALQRRRHGPHHRIGCTLPGRWRRSVDDADRAIDLHLKVRVVKGQWADPEEPRIDLRAGFLRVIDRLAGRVCHAAVATHDPHLANAALARLNAAGTPAELELLYGLPIRQMLPVAKAAGVPVRIYIPYGHAWLPYSLRQVSKNSRIAWWMLRDLWVSDPNSLHRLVRGGTP